MLVPTLLVVVLAAQAPEEDKRPLEPLPKTIDACIREEADDNDSFPDDVRVRFAIDGSSVTEAAVMNRLLAGHPIQACIERALIGLGPAFPAGDRRAVEVIFPSPAVIATGDDEPPGDARAVAPLPAPRTSELFLPMNIRELIKGEGGTHVDPSHPVKTETSVNAAIAGGVGAAVGMATGAGFVAFALPDSTKPSAASFGGLGAIGPLVLGGVVGASLGSAIALLPFLGLHDALFVSVFFAPLTVVSGALAGAISGMLLGAIAGSIFFYATWVSAGSGVIGYGGNNLGSWPSANYGELNAVTAIVPALVFGSFLGGSIGAGCGVVPGALIATVVVPAYAAYELAE